MTQVTAAISERLRTLESEGAGDAVGLAMVGVLVERAEALPASGRERLLARAEALLATYEARVPVAAPEPPPPRDQAEDDAWRAALAARAHQRPPRATRTETFVVEVRARSAAARAAEQVPEAAGPYHGAAVASRALDELAALAPGYVSRYVALLEDLACLTEFPERRVARRKA